MDRRKAMKVAAGVFAGGGLGIFSLTNLFKQKHPSKFKPSHLTYENPGNSWQYAELVPSVSSELAYRYYSEGSCMYATVRAIITQLAEKIGEPYASFPMHMFKYGHGGIGGYGSVCGTLNGAAALIGLIIPDKSIQDRLIADIFAWYEKEALPNFVPKNPALDYTPVRSIPNSVLCHASNTNWCNTSGFALNSRERKEKCRRLSADVASKVSMVLNDVHFNNYQTGVHYNDANAICLSCHGSDGKIKNVSGKMGCRACHKESIGHKLFSDLHYRVMKE
jgi:hypothetical protein